MNFLGNMGCFVFRTPLFMGVIQQILLPVGWSHLVAIQDQYVNLPRSDFSEEGGPATEGCGVCHLAGPVKWISVF